jgi:hypothetical protein
MKKAKAFELPTDPEIISMKGGNLTVLLETLFSNKQYLLHRIQQYLPSEASAADAEDVLTRFCSEDLPQIIRNFDPEKGSFATYFNRSLKYRSFREGEKINAHAYTARSVDILAIPDVSTTAIPGNAWDVLDSLIGQVEGPEDWSEQHDHFLYGTPKH